MAKALQQNPGDVFIQLPIDEYNALLSLLSECEDPERLFELCERERFELSKAQCNRLSKLWAQLAQGNP